jgi:hypothetical protein
LIISSEFLTSTENVTAKKHFYSGYLLFILSWIFIFVSIQPLNAQKKPVNDSARIVKHSPKLATAMSAVVPGLGQVYNRKYWKPPLIYAVFGVLTYFYITNHKEYKIFKDEYGYRINHDTTRIDPKYAGYNNDNIILIRDYYRRNVEITLIIAGVWYILNIIDANVDAHLFTYDISDKLSMKLEPDIKHIGYSQNNKFAGGMKLTLRF